MKCSRCRNFIKSLYQCNICKQKLCSEDCLISHYTLYHQSNISSPVDSHSLNYTINENENNNNNINNQLSNLIVNGIYNNNEIKYDMKYSLDNFILINTKGEPKLIGNGSFGKVYLAKNKNDNEYYAIKHMIKSHIIKYLNNLEQIYNEINIQSRAYHPNIIQLYYVKETDETFDLVLEYAKYGTLFDYMLKCKGLNENLVFKFFIQIVNAIKLLHENNIIHRDIKPENILLFDNYIVKLCDFGWSIKSESPLPGGSFSGTTEYMAPELINNEDYGKEIDIWMLGILLYELVHCFSPFRPKKQNFEEKELIDNIQKHEILFYMPCSDEYKELVFDLLEPDAKKRYTINDIYNSNFVKKHEKEGFIINDNNNESQNSEENENNKSVNINDKSETKKDESDENNIINKKKNLSKNRYQNCEDIKQGTINDNKNKEINLDKPNYNNSIDFPKSKRKESDKLTVSIKKNSNVNSNSKNFDKKDSSPKNNNRNKKRKIEQENSENPNIILNLNNQIKNESEKDNKILLDSTKNIKKEYSINNIDSNLILPNTFLNNKYQKRKKYVQMQYKYNKLDRSEENIKIQNIQITNYIFNNKENKEKSSKDILDVNTKKNSSKENNQRSLTKKLSMNQKNSILSLSLIPKNIDYDSLLNNSPSTESQLIFPNDKNSNNINNDSINSTIQESKKLLNNDLSKNSKEFPFDHIICNSSMNIHCQKTIFNNKMIKIKRLRNSPKNKEGKKYEEIQDKEPNDNMRKKNKKIKNDMPLDNHKKEKEKKNKIIKMELNPLDNYQKSENNNKDNMNNKNDSKYINKENINMNINKTYLNTEEIQTLPSKIIDNKKNKRNYSVRNTNFRAQRRKNDFENNTNKLLKNSKNNIKQNKNLKNVNNKDIGEKNIIKKENLFTNKIIKNGKKSNDVKSNVLKTNELKKYFGDRITIHEIDKLKNQNINKKTKSVNKNREFRFNKDKDKNQFINIKSSKNIIKDKKELGKINKITKIKANINKIDSNEKTKNIEAEHKDKNIDKGNNKQELKSEKDKESTQAKGKNLENKKDKDERTVKLKEKKSNIKIVDIIEENKINNKNEKQKNEINYNKVNNKENNIIKNDIIEKKSEDVKNKEKEKEFKVIIEKEIIEDKYDNFKVKEIYRYKEFVKKRNNNSSKIIKYQSKLDFDFYNKENKDNFEKNIIKNKNYKQNKTESNEKKRDSIKSNKSFSQKNLKQKIEKEELKLCLDNIKQNSKEKNYIKENKTSRLNIELKSKLNKELKLSLNNKYPKKIGSDINSSNSSIYEYDKPQNSEEQSINSSKKKKMSFSNSESKVTKYLKNHISNIKKIKAFSDVNFDNVNNNNKSKSSNERKTLTSKNSEEQKDFEFKLEKSLNNDKISNIIDKENDKKFIKKQKYKKMIKNKTNTSPYKNFVTNKFNNNNNKLTKKLKKENSDLNKKIKKTLKIKNNNIKTEKPKNIKKRYRKSLTESEKENNEIKGNDSESYIIEGDSEYGDTEAF